jgi:hypothetical protein
VAANDKEMLHECWYRGEHDLGIPKSTDQNPIPPSPAVAQSIALAVLCGRLGRVHSTKHFQQRMAVRNFDIFDMEYVIRNGRCIEGGAFCAEYRDHEYTYRGNIDGTDFDATFAISADHDMIQSPLLILVSGCFKTRSGRRGKTF